MRKLFIGLGVLVVLLVAAVLILPSLVPASVYKDKITAQISSTLGRDVQIAGDVKLSVFPTLMAKAYLVKIANADGFSDQAFATMDSLEAKVKLMPLFKKQVEITAFTLVNPTISLEKTKDGQVNWAFGQNTEGEDKPKPAQKVAGAFARDGRYTDLQVALGTFSLENGSINYSDAQTGTNYDVKAVNMKLSMPGLDKPVSAKGDMIVNDMPVDIEFKLDTPKAFLNGETAPVVLKLKSDLITVSADGQFTPSKRITFDLDFDADIPSVSKLDSFMGQNNPYVALTETASIKGNLVFDGTNMVGKNTQVSLKSDIVNTQFNGDFSAGGVPSASGDIKINVTNIKKLQDTLGMAIPQLAAFSTVDISANLSTDGKVTKGKNVSVEIKGDGITAHYTGAATFDNALSYDGMVNLDIPSLRQLAAVGGTALAPDTEVGRVYGPMSVSGQAKGTMTKANFSGANIRFDDLQGRGNFSANLAGKPYITGRLDLQGLDIRPYQAAMYANRPKGVQPWSEQPLNLGFLNMFDGHFTLETPNIIMSSMEMGQSTIKTTVKNGLLKTNIPNVSLYGGKGTLDMELTASTTVPQVALDFTLNNVNGQGLLGAIANFTKLSGNTGTTMSIKGAGRSQAEIMRSLSGGGNFELAEGVISGVDLGQFVGGLNTALQNRALPAGIGSTYTTPFKTLAGLFSVKNGVVTIGDFNLNADTVYASGAGTLDLGQQRVDFSLRPRLKEGKGLAGFGIPIKLSGDFGGIKAGLDTELMTKIVAAQAKAKLQEQITNQIGGNLGGVLGGILGTPQPTPQPAPQPQGETQKPAEKQTLKQEEDKKEEDKREKIDPLAKALNDLFGGD